MDIYGRSEFPGEVAAPLVTLYTSISGPELGHGGSLLEWLLSQNDDRLNGFTRAIYSGRPPSSSRA